MDFTTKGELSKYFSELIEHYDYLLRLEPRPWWVETLNTFIEEEMNKCKGKLKALNHSPEDGTNTLSAYASRSLLTKLT